MKTGTFLQGMTALIVLIATTPGRALPVPLDITSDNSGITDLFSTTFEGSQFPCTVASPSYCSFFGGEPGSPVRNLVIWPNPSRLNNAVPIGITPKPPAGSFLNLSLNGSRTQLTIAGGSIAFPSLVMTIQGGTVNSTVVNASGLGMVFDAAAQVTTIDADGRAEFLVDLAPATAVDFSNFSGILSPPSGSCSGPLCALVAVLNFDMVRYRLLIDYDATFSSFTASFIGQTAGGSLLFVTMDSAPPVPSVPRFSYVRLPLGVVAAVALNNQGQVAFSNGGDAYLWQNGNVTALGARTPIDVNDLGEVLGANWLWQPGVGLTSPGFANATAFNNSGQVVGRGQSSGSAYIWSPASGSEPITIDYNGYLETRFFDTFAMNDSGTVVLSFDVWQNTGGGNGFWTSATNNLKWGSIGDCCSTTTRDASINNLGYAAGETLGAGDGPVAADLPFGISYGCGTTACVVAYLWNPQGQPTYLGFLSFDQGPTGINGLNNLNYVVGTRAEYSNPVGCCTYDVVYRAIFGSVALRLRDLNALIDPHTPLPLGLSLVEAVDINDSNQILAKGSDGASYHLTPVPVTPDTDGDDEQDYSDNCTLVANALTGNVPGTSIPKYQLDSDGDGYGNACDADLNNSGLVTAADFAILRSVLNELASYSPLSAAADLNGSGTVTATDFAILRARLNTPPGPSGLHP